MTSDSEWAPLLYSDCPESVPRLERDSVKFSSGDVVQRTFNPGHHVASQRRSLVFRSRELEEALFLTLLARQGLSSGFE